MELTDLFFKEIVHLGENLKAVLGLPWWCSG